MYRSQHNHNAHRKPAHSAAFLPCAMHSPHTPMCSCYSFGFALCTQSHCTTWSQEFTERQMLSVAQCLCAAIQLMAIDAEAAVKRTSGRLSADRFASRRIPGSMVNVAAPRQYEMPMCRIPCVAWKHIFVLRLCWRVKTVPKNTSTEHKLLLHWTN